MYLFILAALCRFENEMLDLVNKKRIEHNHEELITDKVLQKLADEQAKYMCEQGRLTHESENGGLAHRLNRQSLEPDKLGENLARQQGNDYHAVLRQWMKSPEHRKNILGAFHYTGISSCTDDNGNRYWLQIFSSKLSKSKNKNKDKKDNSHSTQESSDHQEPNEKKHKKTNEPKNKAGTKDPSKKINNLMRGLSADNMLEDKTLDKILFILNIDGKAQDIIKPAMGENASIPSSQAPKATVNMPPALFSKKIPDSSAMSQNTFYTERVTTKYQDVIHTSVLESIKTEFSTVTDVSTEIKTITVTASAAPETSRIPLTSTLAEKVSSASVPASSENKSVAKESPDTKEATSLNSIFPYEMLKNLASELEGLAGENKEDAKKNKADPEKKQPEERKDKNTMKPKEPKKSRKTDDKTKSNRRFPKDESSEMSNDSKEQDSDKPLTRGDLNNFKKSLMSGFKKMIRPKEETCDDPHKKFINGKCTNRNSDDEIEIGSPYTRV
ncbi:hypothetical protein ENBRE01_0749 [Enteropsectra breve]|nr:hypothetical protein ENBRE01_0749 [Enteropsectra breve]